MLVIHLDLALPFLLLALASSWVLQHFAKLKPHMNLEKVVVPLYHVMGILLITRNHQQLHPCFTNLE